MRYTEAVEYIDNIPSFAGKTKPENTREMLRRMGDPQERMKVIHVAGTNGKGSVCAFLSEILIRCGKMTGMFTSPHLVQMTERICINGQEVHPDEFVRAFERMKQIAQEMCADGFSHPAYFEWLFGMGMLIFAWHNVEYLVLETGLGGRMDCTNVIDHPLACVITSLSYDHMKYLGDTLEEIAAHKAGIIKERVPVIFDARCPETERVIREEAKRMHAPCFPLYEDMIRICSKTDKKIDFILNCRYDKKMLLSVSIPARYQVYNASLAVGAAELLAEQEGISVTKKEYRLAMEGKDITGKEQENRQSALRSALLISDETLRQAVSAARWPGRMEQVLPDVFLDGAHNEEGIRQFLLAMKDIAGNRPVSLLFSVMADKAYAGMIRMLSAQGNIVRITVTQTQGSRAVPVRELAREFCRYTDAAVLVAEDPGEAFLAALEKKEDGILFCAGSLYLIGEIKKTIRRLLC